MAEYRGRCKACSRRYERERGTTSQRGYDQAWENLRAMVLAEEPGCRECWKSEMVEMATQVDHIIPIRVRPELRLVRSNLQPLCNMHHAEKTMRDRRL